MSSANTARMTANEQGWQDGTLLELVLDFISEYGMTSKLQTYLEKIAAEENDDNDPSRDAVL